MSRVNNSLLDTDSMDRVGGQLGSNPAGIYLGGSGRRYYVKTLESPAHARNEFIAAKLYQLAGAPTLRYMRTTAPDQVATEWIQLDKKCVAHLSENERKRAQKWFAVHAWTANWDVAGFDGDNQGLANGNVLTLDMGGALNFRAMGDPKGRAFGSSVDELNMLRKDVNNRHALTLFADMSVEEIKQAILLVVKIPDEQIRRVIIKDGGSQMLADKMIARKADMIDRLKA